MGICWYCRLNCKIPYREKCDRIIKKDHVHDKTKSGRCQECNEPTGSKCGDKWLCWVCYNDIQKEQM